MNEISHFPIALPMDRIRRRLKVPPRVSLSRFEELIERYFALVEPRCRFDDQDITVEAGEIILEDGYRMESASLGHHLRDCRKATLMAVTIGDQIEREIHAFQERNKTLEPMILDALGSECVEEAAIFVSGLVNDRIHKLGLVPTKRYSPGYGDLDLEVQKYFFQKLSLEKMGLRLNDSLLMIPQKSITAFIGWRVR